MIALASANDIYALCSGCNKASAWFWEGPLLLTVQFSQELSYNS